MSLPSSLVPFPVLQLSPPDSPLFPVLSLDCYEFLSFSSFVSRFSCVFHEGIVLNEQFFSTHKQNKEENQGTEQSEMNEQIELPTDFLLRHLISHPPLTPLFPCSFTGSKDFALIPMMKNQQQNDSDSWNKEVGHGLITLIKIPLGSFLGLYTGRLCSWMTSSSYRSGDVDSQTSGSASRFIQHLPLNTQEKYNFLLTLLCEPLLYSLYHGLSYEKAVRLLADQKETEKKREKIQRNFRTEENEIKFIQWKEKQGKTNNFATANVIKTSGKVSIRVDEIEELALIENETSRFIKCLKRCGGESPIEFEVDLLFAMRDIKPYEMLGFSYGRKYWMKLTELFPNGPLLFDRWGNVKTQENYYSWNWEQTNKRKLEAKESE
jgi:hypothetical protein